MRIGAAELKDFVTRIFLGSGSDEREAEIVAQHLVDSCLVGHDSHGVIRVLPYVKAIAKGDMHANRRPQTIFENETMVTLDGMRGYGQVAAFDATEMAIRKAAKSGMAMYTVRNAGHVGRLGAWAEQAAQAGQAVIHFANSVHPGGAQIAPFGGSDRRLYVGPICFGLPVQGGDPIVLDISTAASPMGKIHIARNQGKRLREACIIGADGQLTDDPNALFGPPPGALLPFGGHKGYGLCVFTDLFAGILSGGGVDRRGESTGWYPANNMMAIHIDVGLLQNHDSIRREVLDYADWVKASPPREPGTSVMLPGEIEAALRRKNGVEGIEIDATTWNQIIEAAEMVGVAAESPA